MNLSTDITLELINHGSDTERPTSLIRFKGEPTQQSIQGKLLQACVTFESRYLVFVIDDIPSEEALYITLLDSDFAVLDSASLGAAYSTGCFANLALHPPAKVSFDFIGGIHWSLVLFRKPKWRIPLIGDPKGVLHTPALKRYFKLQGRP